jgi:hypothetical protein
MNGTRIGLPGEPERQQHPERHRGNGKQPTLLARIVAQQERAEELVIGDHDLPHDAGLLAVLEGIADFEPVVLGIASGRFSSGGRFGRSALFSCRRFACGWRLLRERHRGGQHQRGDGKTGGDEFLKGHRLSLGSPEKRRGFPRVC